MIPISDPDLKTQRRPYVNVALIAISVLVFIYELTLNDLETLRFFYRFGVIPEELASGVDYQVLQTRTQLVDIASAIPTWGTVFTSMFIHGGWLHLIGNMAFLWVFGDNVEDRLGHVKYLLFYLACGVAATWTQVALKMDSQVPNVGASGAIAGVLGAYLLLYPYSTIRTLVVMFFIFATRIPAVVLLGFWFLLQLFSGVGSLGPSAQTGGGVAYWAHVGGFVAGVLAILLLKLLVWREPVWPRRRYRTY